MRFRVRPEQSKGTDSLMAPTFSQWSVHQFLTLTAVRQSFIVMHISSAERTLNDLFDVVVIVQCKPTCRLS